MKHEHFDPGIDVVYLEKFLSQPNNFFCLDAHGLSKCHIVYAHEVLRVILVKLFNSFLTQFYSIYIC